MPKTISPDATVASVFDNLTYKDKYVRGALRKMRECNKKYGNSIIRTGTTGTGQKPYYQISHSEDGKELVFGSFHDNHDPLEKASAASSTWSSKSMTFDELLNFYADAIGFSGTRQ